MKNKQIHQLLEDIEANERDTVVYQNTLVSLRDKLAESTKEVDAMAGEYAAMKESSKHYDALIEGLQAENSRLTNLLEEYQREKEQWDAKMEDIGKEVCKK